MPSDRAEGPGDRRARGHRQERNKLSGVKQAELEIREEEESRNAAIEVQLARDAAKRAKEEAKRKKKEDQDPSLNTNGPAISNSIPPVEDGRERCPRVNGRKLPRRCRAMRK